MEFGIYTTLFLYLAGWIIYLVSFTGNVYFIGIPAMPQRIAQVIEAFHPAIFSCGVPFNIYIGKPDAGIVMNIKIGI